MARVSLGIEGGAQLEAALKKLGREGEAAVSRAVTATAIEVRGDIVKRYQRGPASGIVYNKSNPTRTHRASAEGEAPATDTGRLAGATEYTSTGRFSAEVGNSVEYGPMLEFGTQNIKPRPAWVPAVEAAAPKYIKRLETALARIIK